MQKIFAGLLVVLMVSLAIAQDWPRYLGSEMNGISKETGLNWNWEENKPEVLWTNPLGEGFAGAAIVDGMVYVLDRADSTADVFRCFDLKTGKEQWKYLNPDPGAFSFNGSRATPTIENGRAYTVGAMGTVYCIDLKTRKPVWTKNFINDFDEELPTWAYSQSPLLYKDLMIVAPQGVNTGVVAYNKNTGDIIWKTDRLCNMAGYSSPILTVLDGVEQIVQVTPYLSPELREEEEEEETEPWFEKGGVYGIDIKTGKVLWNYKPFDCVITIPPVTVIGDGRMLVTGGYDAATTMIRVTRKGGKWDVQELYKKEGIKPQIHPAILYENHLYMIANDNESREGLVCMTLDGEILWQTKRRPNFERGGLMLADGKLLIVEGKIGDLHAVDPSPEAYMELGNMKLLNRNQVWGPLALSNGHLVVRDQKQIVCVKMK